MTRSRGFTLIEVMLVVFIVGMMAGGVALVASRDGVPQQIREQSRSLQDTIRRVQTQAMISRQFFGMTMHEGGWSVYKIEPKADFLSWGAAMAVDADQTSQEEVKDPFALEPTSGTDRKDQDERKLPWTSLRRQRHSLPPSLEVDLFFEGSDTSVLAFEEGDPPQIIFSAQGEVTPFILVLRAATGDAESVLEVMADGRVVDVDASEDL